MKSEATPLHPAITHIQSRKLGKAIDIRVVREPANQQAQCASVSLVFTEYITAPLSEAGTAHQALGTYYYYVMPMLYFPRPTFLFGLHTLCLSLLTQTPLRANGMIHVTLL